MMILRIFIIIFIICGNALFSYAGNVKDPSLQLKIIKNKLSNETSKQKALNHKIILIEKEINSIKKRLVKSAQIMRQKENNLEHIQKRITKLEERRNKISKDLENERISIVNLILILERIRKTPPEAMIARPNSPYKTAQSALLMENIIPSVKRHAKHLKNNLEMLNTLSKELEIEQKKLKSETIKWKKKSEDLMVLVKKKENLYTKTNKDLESRKLSIENISLKAKNLKDLIKKLQNEEQLEIKRQKTANIFRQKPIFSYENDNNTQAQLPISGIIRTSYNGKNEFGAKSNGIVIEGRSGGLVIAPISGKIQFIGSFKRYSNIIIIKHKDGYHSLIAGMGKINAIMGDYVKSGEPIGLMPDSSLIPRPKLYYELRKNGVPINPSVKFSDLG